MRCGGLFSIIQFSNISSDLRYKKDPTGIRSFGQSTLTKRSSYFHIRWLRHFPKVKHYPLSGLVGEGSTDVQGKSQTCTGCERQCPPGAVERGGGVLRQVLRVRIFTLMALPAMHGAYLHAQFAPLLHRGLRGISGNSRFSAPAALAPKITRRCVPIRGD